MFHFSEMPEQPFFTGFQVDDFITTDKPTRYWKNNHFTYAVLSVILDYGEYWYRKLRECVEEQGLNQAETAKEMKCITTTVRKRAEEIGLDLHANRKSCIYHEKDWKDIDRSQYFRKKVSEALQYQPELTAKELDGLVPGAYAWFHKNDFQWLKERLVIDQGKRRKNPAGG